jgi:hypothetical protein
VKPLTSNRELYEYLRSLAKTLENRQANELGELIDRASKTSACNISTEFLGESRIALRRLIKEERGVLTDQERADVKNVLDQLDGAFEFRRYRR